jgi:hypothetical protein
MEGYAAQPFPGPIDRGLLPQGRAVYAQACAACHGVYDDRLTQPRLVSFPNRTGDIGTDPDRARLSTPALIDAVNGGLFGQYITARTTTTYAAPPLAGIWARARYLHNGSFRPSGISCGPPCVPGRLRWGDTSLILQLSGSTLYRLPITSRGRNPSRSTPPSLACQMQAKEVGFAGLSETGMNAILAYLKLL